MGKLKDFAGTSKPWRVCRPLGRIVAEVSIKTLEGGNDRSRWYNRGNLPHGGSRSVYRRGLSVIGKFAKTSVS